LHKTPAARFGHSLNQYRNFLVLYGGAGTFNMEIKKRETFDELFLYDIEKDRWLDPVHHRNDETLSSYALKHTPSSQHDDNSLLAYSL
jgi:hypothetical protein